MSDSIAERLARTMPSTPDFPTPGILFRDTLFPLRDPELFSNVVEALKEIVASYKPDLILGLDARGFIFGTPVACALKLGFLAARKPGKLPGTTISESYKLEYGETTLELQPEGLAGKRVAIIDDLLATGGTARAAENLIHAAQGSCVGSAFVVELGDLNGKDQLQAPHQALLCL